jgi:uncharacterized integral membrane protein
MSLQNTGSPAGVGPPASSPQPVASPRNHRIRRTRAGGVWVALAVSAVVLILLLIFILVNLKRANINFFGAHVTVPIGVALLLAAAAGALIVVIPGTARIVQLRMTARRHRQVDAQAATAGPAVVSAPAPVPEQDIAVPPGPADVERGGATQADPEPR